MQLQQGPLSNIPSSIKIPLWRRDRDGCHHPCHQGLPRPYNQCRKAQSTKRDRLLLLLLSLHVVVVAAVVDQIWAAPPSAWVQVSESRFPLLLPGSWHNGCEISIIFCTLWMPFSAGGYISLVAIQIIIDNANARGEFTKKCGTFWDVHWYFFVSIPTLKYSLTI